MDSINACYWKLQYLCGLETDQWHCGQKTRPQLQFQRINFQLNNNKSFPRLSTFSVGFLSVRTTPRKTQQYNHVSYLYGCPYKRKTASYFKPLHGECFITDAFKCLKTLWAVFYKK